jgi:uncharacterized protein (UPF0332 family)
MKPEVNKLLDKARASQRAAGLLQNEGFSDFAASRAYYAMFYAAEALLLDRGLSFASHAAVIAAFGKEFAKTGVLDQRLHRYLIDAQDLRNVGDYATGAAISAEQVEDLMAWTEEFLTEAEALLASNG